MEMENGETSQATMTEETFDGDLNFDDIEEPQESAEAQPEEEPQEVEEPTDFLTVRFNKADKKLTKAEAVELAQKGLNYDHVKAELDSYRDGPIGKAIKAYADQAGMSVEKYAEMMAQQAEAAEEKRLITELQEKYPEAPDELLKDYAKMQREGTKAQAQSAEEAKRQQEWADALAEFPDIKPDAIPQDVHEAVAEGVSPLMALMKHKMAEQAAKIAELTAEKETKKKQEDNRARSTGSLASSAKSQDDFMSEFA